MSDAEWDQLYFELVKREEIDGTIYPDSPTQKVIFQTVSELNKVKHNHLMLSLDKTKDVNELQSFVNNPDYKDAHGWLGMFKMDGLTCSLRYLNGELISGETRGNGIEGEDITHNVFIINNIPRKISYKDELIVDGEIICDYETFKQFEKDYANPRNFAAGSIRQLSSAEAASRHLSFIAWDLIKGYDDIDFFAWRLEKLDDLGFTTVPRVCDAETIEDAMEILHDMRAETPAGTYPIDGYVFRFESQKYYENCGRTDHHFRGAIAFKFYDEEYETRLKYIDYDVSRNGILTPVAVFEPIEIDGSICERASLHNISVMEEILGVTPYVGEQVYVQKSNMIIPQITKADKRDYGDIISHGGVTTGLGGDYGVLCPICGHSTSIKISAAGVKVLYCDNEQCEGKLAQQIDHYCSIKGLDIKGLSRKTIEKLIDWTWLNNIFDIYTLRIYQKEWINKPGFGQTSVLKILDAIDESKKDVDLASFISALGIPLVGKTVAKEIIKYYNTWEDFRAAIGGDWTEFDGFGPELSKAINNFDYTEANKIAGLLTFKQPEVQGKVTSAAAIKDKKFCATGKLKNFTRDSLKADIEANGGKMVSSVTSATDYLITNTPDSGTAKNRDAQRLGVKIITEEEYLQMKS